MKTIGTYELKANFSQILKEVAQGKQFTVTRNGEPIAELVPVPPTVSFLKKPPRSRSRIRQHK
jgi:prevent-host-death family protein